MKLGTQWLVALGQAFLWFPQWDAPQGGDSPTPHQPGSEVPFPGGGTQKCHEKCRSVCGREPVPWSLLHKKAKKGLKNRASTAGFSRLATH